MHDSSNSNSSRNMWPLCIEKNIFQKLHCLAFKVECHSSILANGILNELLVFHKFRSDMISSSAF